MNGRAAFCPNCGAPVRFLWSSAVQTTCEFCKSILVRRDLDLERVGVTADLPGDASPIQLLTEGVYRGKSFQVIGRIMYRYDQGAWNEWHCVFQDGASGWLSDAQAEYAVSFLTQPPTPLPSPTEVSRGLQVSLYGALYEVTTLTEAFYEGVQGELPFEYWDKSRCLFADLRTRDARFGTIDYTETPPLLFLGEWVDFEALKLKNLRQFEGW